MHDIMRYWTLIEIPYTGGAADFQDTQSAVFAELPNITNIARRMAGFGMQSVGSSNDRASVYAVIEASGPLEAVAIAMLAARTAISASRHENSFDTSRAVLRVAPEDEAELIYDQTEPWVMPASWDDEN